MAADDQLREMDNAAGDAKKELLEHLLDLPGIG
jgi:hypothetical protein